MRLDDYLNRDERAALREPSDLVGALQVLGNCALIARAFALFGLYPNLLTFVLSTRPRR